MKVTVSKRLLKSAEELYKSALFAPSVFQLIWGEIMEEEQENQPATREELWEDFVNSDGWHSFCITPLSWRDMVFAVAYGDAEVKYIDDNNDDWPPDLFFRWLKPIDERSYEYFKKPLEDCGCNSEQYPKPKDDEDDKEND